MCRSCARFGLVRDSAVAEILSIVDAERAASPAVIHGELAPASPAFVDPVLMWMCTAGVLEFGADGLFTACRGGAL